MACDAFMIESLEACGQFSRGGGVGPAPPLGQLLPRELVPPDSRRPRASLQDGGRDLVVYREQVVRNVSHYPKYGVEGELRKHSRALVPVSSQANNRGYRLGL